MDYMLLTDFIDAGIEQELAFMFVPARGIWESTQIRIDWSIQTCLFENWWAVSDSNPRPID